MRSKRFLIIDEDEVIVGLLQRSLSGLDPNCQITTERRPNAAVVRVAAHSFDAIIADSALLEEIGPQLVQLLPKEPSAHPAIIATRYGNSPLHFGDLPVYRILTKPIQMQEFLEMMQEFLGIVKDDKLDNAPLPEVLYDEARLLMESVRKEINARCILLSDPVGRIIQQTGNAEGLAIDAITSLLSGGIATLLEAGKNLDDQPVINLAYREGKQSDLYAINIHDDWILIIVIDRGLTYQRLGTVWFYARKAAVELGKIRVKLEQLQPIEPFTEPLDQAYNDELDKLFQ